MSDYISREAFKKKYLCCGFLPEMSEEEFDSFPTADVAEVRHGRWVRPHWRNSSYCCDCSECGGEAMHREYQWNRKGIYPICPNCGVKMDLEGDNGT